MLESQLFQSEIGLAGSFSKTIFVKADVGYVILACIDTGAVFEYKEEIKQTNDRLLLSTERIAELLIEAESKRAGPHGPASVSVKIFKDIRYPDLLIKDYAQALMTSLTNFCKKLGHPVINALPVTIRKCPLRLEQLVLQEIIEMVHPQYEDDYNSDTRLEYEYTKTMGFPTHSLSRIPGYWDARHMIFPSDLREKIGSYIEKWINKE